MSDKWKKEGLVRSVYALKQWFYENNIKTDDVNIIINLPNIATQANVQFLLANLQKEKFYTINLKTNGEMPPDEIELLNIKIKFTNPEKYYVSKGF